MKKEEFDFHGSFLLECARCEGITNEKCESVSQVIGYQPGQSTLLFLNFSEIKEQPIGLNLFLNFIFLNFETSLIVSAHRLNNYRQLYYLYHFDIISSLHTQCNGLLGFL